MACAGAIGVGLVIRLSVVQSVEWLDFGLGSLFALCAVPWLIFLIWFSGREKQQAERKLREAERSASLAAKAKSQFLAHTSHEIRAPMASVLGLVDLLLELDLPEQAWDHARTLSSSAESLRRILHENLEASKIETGDIVFEIRTFSLREFVAETMDLLRPAAADKGITLEAEIAPEMNDRRKGDLHRLRQVLLKLLGNAIKFTQRGRVDLIVEPGDAGGGVRFTIKDTGVGLTLDEQERIFKPAGVAATARRTAGTELGLSISRQIAELMGGSISVESSPNKGSTFTFTAAIATASPPVD